MGPGSMGLVSNRTWIPEWKPDFHNCLKER
jgi:hypothetical protein